MQYQFKDAKFMTAKEKAMVLKQWETFLKNGLKLEHFTDRLYKHLINHCSFIAHYDRIGFYSTYFENGEDTVHFLSQFNNRDRIPKSIEYGDTYWIAGGNDVSGEYYDINIAMCNVAQQHLPELTKNAEISQANSDIAQAKALLGKHGILVPVKGRW